MTEFAFELGSTVKLTMTDENGTVIGRSQYLKGENVYSVRYKAADGRQVEQWWIESALVKA